jgi:hypothetical protein
MKHKSPRKPPLLCEERERLEKAWQNALQDRYALEDRTTHEIVSNDKNKAKLAKKQAAKALKHAIHILEELLAHRQKHRCV